MAALLPGSAPSKRKTSQGYSTVDSTDGPSPSHGAEYSGLPEGFSITSRVFGRPLTEVCIDTYPPTAIRVTIFHFVYLRSDYNVEEFRSCCMRFTRAVLKYKVYSECPVPPTRRVS